MGDLVRLLVQVDHLKTEASDRSVQDHVCRSRVMYMLCTCMYVPTLTGPSSWIS